MATETTIQKLRPEEAAEQVFAAHRRDSAWLDRFAECLAGYREGAAGEQASLSASPLRSWRARSRFGSSVRRRPRHRSV